MPTTRKKQIKTVFKDEDSESGAGDFSASESDAYISDVSDHSSSEEEENAASEEEFKSDKKKGKKPVRKKKTKFAKEFISKITKQSSFNNEEDMDVAPALFSVKDLTDADKLLPSVLNLSESDSSDDDHHPKKPTKNVPSTSKLPIVESESENEGNIEYRDVWSKNQQENSEEIAKKAFMELEQHKSRVEETKAHLQSYVPKDVIDKPSNVNVKDLLALGEEISPQKSPIKKKTKTKKLKADSDSEVEDWEEVKESKSIPSQGLQLVVKLPDTVCRKTKKIDVEMMMKRKINRVKKEYQVYMHKVHVLCWLGHGNYVSRILNDQEIMAATLSMVPKGCYPEDRLNMKYVEDITKWYKDKITIKEDKNENKFRPKAPPLKSLLLDQIKSRAVTGKKYAVFIFVSMLRSLGLQCRIMFNFVTLSIKPPSSELCSLSTKPKEDKAKMTAKEDAKQKKPAGKLTKPKADKKIAQLDGNYDEYLSSDDEFDNIMQVDGSDDTLPVKARSTRSCRLKHVTENTNKNNEDASPPKRPRKGPSPAKNFEDKPTKTTRQKKEPNTDSTSATNIKDIKSEPVKSPQKIKSDSQVPLKTKSPKLTLKKNTTESNKPFNEKAVLPESSFSPRKTRGIKTAANTKVSDLTEKQSAKRLNAPSIVVTDEKNKNIVKIESKYFIPPNEEENKVKPPRKRGHTTIVNKTQKDDNESTSKVKTRTRSAPGNSVEKSKYFNNTESDIKKPKLKAKEDIDEDKQRVSHKDLIQRKAKPKNDVTEDLVGIIKSRIKDAKQEAKKKIVKGKVKEESDENSDYISEEEKPPRVYESDEDFKPTKISPKPKVNLKSNKKIDRRVLSTDDEAIKTIGKVNVWCEIYVEELEQWISVDVINGKIHCNDYIYSHCTHPVCYIVGWDNNNYLKDLTRRYVPHWNTVTRKQRAEPEWWKVAIQPWLGPKTARDREEDEQLDRMQLEAPLPKSIAEYKNHPLYALRRHLLKFEAIYPPDAATLGFVRSEPVYARECVYTCRSRDTWLKEAKVVKLGEEPYKVVKARPKWDKLSNKLITDKPLEVFGPWQVQDYEPPVAENGIVPRNAYGNVELFKDCMLPKGTVHIKLPGLNKVAKKLNIDCAPAMTGFDFNGGWSHPVYDGFVVCKEFEEIVTEAWVKDQEDQVRREREKIETRVYGNWKRLIKGLLIKERLKLKYGFEEPSTSQNKKDKSKGPRFVVRKK